MFRRKLQKLQKGRTKLQKDMARKLWLVQGFSVEGGLSKALDEHLKQE